MSSSKGKKGAAPPASGRAPVGGRGAAGTRPGARAPAASSAAVAAPRGRGGAAPRARGAATAAAAASRDSDDDNDDDDEGADDDNIASSGTESDDLDLTRAARDDDDDGGDDDDDDDDDEGDEDDDEDPNTVNVEFTFLDPREIDFKSVRRLLERYLPGEEDSFDASGCAEAIIAQQAVGTMVKVNDDLDVYAFATVLPVAVHKDTAWMKAIRRYLVSRAPEAGGVRARLDALFDGSDASGLGLLLNERVVNMPPELAPAIQESLATDVAWAQANATPPEARAAFNFKHLLLVAPCFSERAGAEAVAAHRDATRAAAATAAGAAGARGWAPTAGAAGGKKKAKRAREGGGGSAEAAAAVAAAPSAASATAAPDGLGLGDGWLTHYLHFEEELFTEAAALSFVFPVAPPADKPAAAVPVAAAAAAGGKKRKASKGGAAAATAAAGPAAAAAGGDGEADDGDAGGRATQPLHGPQSRRVIVLPAAAHGRCVDAMKQLLASAAGE